tara:strand:- start:234 stop:635 length:402 start_codon:yes stop_codon:yes gene_type:complete
MGDFVLYTRKMLNNPMLGRRQVLCDLIHPEKGSVPKKEIKAKLAGMFKCPDETISVFGVKSKFGGGRSTCFGLIYSNMDARKKFDMKKLLKRDKLLSTGGPRRKARKEMKGREKRVRGIEKAKARGESGKKKK